MMFSLIEPKGHPSAAERPLAEGFRLVVVRRGYGSAARLTKVTESTVQRGALAE
ncbi:hypothetical protein GCM10009504_32570 [Pseudomonas laurentiana]|nr:hypothetical protein GCM10009504_32570 [Pseudomonas laurentiana]